MAVSGETPTGGSQVVFPCDIPQWPEIRYKLLALQSEQNPKSLVAELNQIYGLVPRPKGEAGSAAGIPGVFIGLERFICSDCSAEESIEVMSCTIPTIICWAVRIEDLRPVDGLLYSTKQSFAEIQLSRELVAAIVACAFLCLFPYRKTDKHSTYNNINFDTFFKYLSNTAQCSKLRCILHYFDRLAELPGSFQGSVSFIRKGIPPRFLPKLDEWKNMTIALCPIKIHRQGSIEDSEPGTMQVDFANKKLGGGVIRQGRVQEEIRFCLSPELLAGLLFMEAMDDNEAIWCYGFETFSCHTGYGRTLQFNGDNRDSAMTDSNGNLNTLLCAIDALSKASQRQYETQNIVRDLVKAYVGMASPRTLQARQLASEQCQNYERRLSYFASTLCESFFPDAMKEAALQLSAEQGNIKIVQQTTTHQGRELRAAAWSKERADSDSSRSSLELDRWPFASRRRSSGLSDSNSSRRSSDISRRSSSSARHSGSDFSAEIEEYFESNPRQDHRHSHAPILEETGPPLVQEFVNTMITNLVRHGSGIAAASGVQMFADCQPPDVARPCPILPSESLLRIEPSQLDSVQEETPTPPPSATLVRRDSFNQTDDQKIRDNIVVYVESMVQSSLAIARHSPPSTQESETLDTSIPISQQGTPRLLVEERSHVVCPELSTSHRRHSIDDILQTRILNSSSSSSHSLSSHNGECLTDDIKRALGSYDSAHSLETSPNSGPVSRSTPINIISRSPVQSGNASQVRSRQRQYRRRSTGSPLDSHQVQSFADNLVNNSLVSAVDSLSLNTSLSVSPSSLETSMHTPPTGLSPNSNRTRTSSFASFSRSFGMNRSPRSRGYHRGRSLEETLPSSIPSDAPLWMTTHNATYWQRRKGSADDAQPFQSDLAMLSREEHKQARRKSLGFHDPTLADFHKELLKSQPFKSDLFISDWSTDQLQTSSSSSYGRGSMQGRRGSNSSFNSSRRGSNYQGSDMFAFLNTVKDLRPTVNSMLESGSTDLIDKSSPSTTKAVLLDFLTNSMTDQLGVYNRQDSFTAHLDWFAHDLILDAFNDSFCELYGNCYADIIKSLQRKEQEAAAKAADEEKIVRFAENLVDKTVEMALPDAARIRKASQDEEEFVDALDVPYVAIEKFARNFSSGLISNALRDINKPDLLKQDYFKRPVATGNWGCGAFRGDPQLKALIQWVAASAAGVPLLNYYTFADDRVHEIERVINEIKHDGWTAGELLSRIIRCCEYQRECSWAQQQTLFQLIFDDDLLVDSSDASWEGS